MQLKQRIIFKNTFRKANKKLPDFISSTVSKLNVENVLKPPQNPVSKKRMKVSLDKILPRVSDNTNAKIKQLTTFDVRVETGRDTL